MAEAVSSPAADEVKPYKIHIPTKHLDLTRQKLELTRLPHEPLARPGNSGSGREQPWAPKPVIEPLIDYWLEAHDWRAAEARLNNASGRAHAGALPQFRTAIPLPPSCREGGDGGGGGPPVRVHFVHARSSSEGHGGGGGGEGGGREAVPLLLVPPFPLPVVGGGFEGLVRALTTGVGVGPAGGEGEGKGKGIGQDGGEGGGGKGSEGKGEEKAGEGVVVGGGGGGGGGGGQTFHVVMPSLPGTAFSDPLPDEIVDGGGDPVGAVAGMFDALMRRLGYERYLVSAVAPGWVGAERVDERIVRALVGGFPETCVGGHLISPTLKEPGWKDGVGEWGRWVMAKVVKGGWGYEKGDFEALDKARGGKEGAEKERGVGGMGSVTDPTTLAYALCDSPVGMLAFVLKGLRLSAGLEAGKGRFTQEELITLTSLMWLPGPEGMLRFWAACGKHRENEQRRKGAKPRVAITVFTEGTVSGKGKQTAPVTAAVDDEKDIGLWPTPEEVAGRKERYCPPAWANPIFNVVHTQRVPGPSSGLLALEQPEVILAGIRGLAKAAPLRDLLVAPVAPLQGVVIVPAENTKQTAQIPAQVPKPVATPAILSGSPPTKADTAVPAKSSETVAVVDKQDKGKAPELLSPGKGPSSEDESPNTLVEDSPPLERA